MRKRSDAKSILTLNKTVIDKMSFERFSDNVNKIDEKGEITFSYKVTQLGELIFKVTLGVCISSKDGEHGGIQRWQLTIIHLVSVKESCKFCIQDLA